jgi:hypothetical protein
MVCEKRAPGLGWWLAMTHHVFSNCGF